MQGAASLMVTAKLSFFFNDAYRHRHRQFLNRMMNYNHRRLHFRHCHCHRHEGVVISHYFDQLYIGMKLCESKLMS